MHKLGVEEWLVSAVMAMYLGANMSTVVRTAYGNTEGFEFEVNVGMHQGPGLSVLLSWRQFTANLGLDYLRNCYMQMI